MKLQKLLTNIHFEAIFNEKECEIVHITNNSEEIVPNSAFIAVKGAHFDGHSFIQKAIEKGAVLIFCQDVPDDIPKEVTFVKVVNTNELLARGASNFYDNPSQKIHLIGVTGTNGKTTTATLLYQLFEKMGYKAGLISTIAIFVHKASYETKNTTPDALTIHSFLHKMVLEGVTHCFMEVSSHGICQKRVAGLHFSGGIFTNLTHDHLDYHQTFSAYRDAKKLFFDNLPKTAFALTNLDDRNGAVMLQNTKASKKSYALQSFADFRLKIIENHFTGLILSIDNQELHTQLTGKFNAYNLLAVYATARLLGMDSLEVLKTLSTLTPVGGRFQQFVSPTNITIIVDYAHTPDALQNVLDTINNIRKGSQRLITLVGCGGNRDKAKRPVMAKISVENSDEVVFTSDNPRDEDPAEILAEMISGVSENYSNRYLSILDRREAIKTACKLAKPSDIILIAGKGHERYQEVRGVKTHFDDLEEAISCFR